MQDIIDEVRTNAKQRFEMWAEAGTIRICASQGHSMRSVNDEELLVPITNADELPICVHGTRYYSHGRKVYENIMHYGLDARGRNHIHFMPRAIESSGVISGMRQSSEVAIYVDVRRAMRRGITFYRSSNDVVLTRGDSTGRITPDLFSHTMDIRTRRQLWPSTSTQPTGRRRK